MARVMFERALRAKREQLISMLLQTASTGLAEDGLTVNEITAMIGPLELSLREWWDEHYEHKDPDNPWPCLECQERHRLCESCISRAAIEDDGMED